MRLPDEVLELLQGRNNLLAFSYGADSTALFHRLGEVGIFCDLAMVDYGLREESASEAEAAGRLARERGVRLHRIRAPEIGSDFEHEARRFRYRFFEELIERYGYENLLTGHQLDDRLEWMLMRLFRGAGAMELAGMRRIERRETAGGAEYRLIRPLLDRGREEIRDWLGNRGIVYFEDSSNEEPRYERNRIRREFARAMIGRYKEGIRRSFDCLEADRNQLEEGFTLCLARRELRIYRVCSDLTAMYAADRGLKDLGHLMGYSERKAIRSGSGIVVGRRWAVEHRAGRLWIAPYHPDTVVPKSFRERCRLVKIPPGIRPYLYRQRLAPEAIVDESFECPDGR